MTTKNIKTGSTYSYTNQHGYTTRVVVLEFNEKSVFYCWAGFNTTGRTMRARMSRKSFEKYSEEAPKNGVSCQVEYNGKILDAINFGAL